jgi:hypothetical protein
MESGQNGKTYHTEVTFLNHFGVKDDIVVRRWDVGNSKVIYWQAIVPLKQRRMVLQLSQDIKASRHLGVTKT